MERGWNEFNRLITVVAASGRDSILLVEFSSFVHAQRVSFNARRDLAVGKNPIYVTAHDLRVL
jgi:hypothetical protein